MDGAIEDGVAARSRVGGGMRVNVRSALRDLIAAGLPDRASALTLYGALCVLAALAALLGLLGLIGSHPETSNAVLDVIRTVGGIPLRRLVTRDRSRT